LRSAAAGGSWRASRKAVHLTLGNKKPTLKCPRPEQDKLRVTHSFSIAIVGRGLEKSMERGKKSLKIPN